MRHEKVSLIFFSLSAVLKKAYLTGYNVIKTKFQVELPMKEIFSLRQTLAKFESWTQTQTSLNVIKHHSVF